MTTRERGRNEREREAEMSVRVSCDLGWAAMATTIWAEAETRVIERVRKRQRVIRISESEARVSFEGWGLNFFNMLQKMPYRGKKKVERRRLRLETRQPPEPREPVTVHRTEQSDCGSDGSMLFSHGTVQHLKQTVEVNGSRVFRSDRTVWSGFKFHVFYLTLHFSTFLFLFFFAIHPHFTSQTI